MELAGATVLVTGATGGLGPFLCEELSARGALLLLSSRSPEPLAELAERYRGQALPADLALPGEPERLAEEAGPVDVLVANAALPASGELLSFSVAELDRALIVNLRAPAVLARLLLQGMVERRRGHLLFVGSLAGRAATPYSSLYNATKFGLRGFALALRAELAGQGVGVSVVEPGFVAEAGMFARSGAKLPPLIGTVSPRAVAKAVATAIEHNRGEVAVAPPLLRASAAFANALPELSRRILSWGRGERVAAAVAAGQRELR